ncbi:hypothetical protein BDR07DRAFT_326453 [Suillus spraguei]|nr:hypothetical protein BDR07DRAFT_326453 [Suillus spraguei]
MNSAPAFAQYFTGGVYMFTIDATIVHIHAIDQAGVSPANRTMSNIGSSTINLFFFYKKKPAGHYFLTFLFVFCGMQINNPLS